MEPATGKDSKGPVESGKTSKPQWLESFLMLFASLEISFRPCLTAQLAEVVQHHTAKASQHRQPTADNWQPTASCFPRQLSMHAWLALVQLASAEVLCWRDSVPQRCGASDEKSQGLTCALRRWCQSYSKSFQWKIFTTFHNNMRWYDGILLWYTMIIYDIIMGCDKHIQITQTYYKHLNDSWTIKRCENAASATRSRSAWSEARCLLQRNAEVLIKHRPQKTELIEMEWEMVVSCCFTMIHFVSVMSFGRFLVMSSLNFIEFIETWNTGALVLDSHFFVTSQILMAADGTWPGAAVRLARGKS